MHCFACNATIDLAAGERVGFRDECPACGADLHVCCNCSFHDRSAYNECRESSAERVSVRDRANRCDYFTPGEATGGAAAKAPTIAKASLESLFKKP